jgi:hypothetical protein
MGEGQKQEIKWEKLDQTGQPRPGERSGSLF